jgi:hypothetical protein
MGNFYTNYTLKGVSQQAVASAMSGRTAIVTPASRDVVTVFDSASDSQDDKILADLAAKLSTELNCATLAILNHDDDILWYQLYEGGALVDHYNSSPDYFDFRPKGQPRGPTGGNAEKLCRAFGSEHVARVETILRKSALDEDGYVFAFQRHADLFEALGLPSFGVAVSYASFEEGEIPEDLPAADVIHTK